MSFAEAGLGNTVKNQFFYKWKAYAGVFHSMIALQLLGMLFSVGSVSSRFGGRFGIDLHAEFYSFDIIIVFTMLWLFINMILILTRDYRNDDFLFVTNRMSHNLANGLFMVAASFIGGITSFLGGLHAETLSIYFYGF